MRGHPLLLVPALAVLTCAVLAGCTSAGTPGASGRAVASSPRPAASGRIGSPGNPLPLSCAEESFPGYPDPPIPPRARPGDLAIGPLIIVNGKRLATADPAGYGQHGSYKVPLVVLPGRVVTVTIAAPARAWVTIDNPYAHQRGVSDVTAAIYHSCPHATGFFAQGFAFGGGRVRGCVPLDVRIGNETRVRHVTLSLFAGSCPS